ncbi:MAG: radical SAM protein [Candidatus Thorarchaeota archaeon]
MTNVYPFIHHPCWSEQRQNLWERIHLPVALKCNVKCVFCDHNSGSSCHTSKPGFSTHIFNVDDAIERTAKEMSIRPNLKIVAISGPGEPLYNKETFSTLKRIRLNYPEMEFCLSTNGTLLSENLDDIVSLGVSTISISISSVKPETVSRIYEWARFDNRIYRNDTMARMIVGRQLEGLSQAVSEGIKVKVNTILIPKVNDQEISDIASAICNAGASIHNIVPLVPCSFLEDWNVPKKHELDVARKEASQYLPQFHQCKQCRSDVVGIPGADTTL